MIRWGIPVEVHGPPTKREKEMDDIVTLASDEHKRLMDLPEMERFGVEYE